MSQSEVGLSPNDYASILEEYLRGEGESALYRASLLSQSCIESGLGPEDIVALHFESLEKTLPAFAYREHARVINDANQFLLEMMIAYGVKYKEYLELRISETLHDAEARVARARERATEMERLQREKSELLGVIAHEMGTPITVVRGNLDLVKRSLQNGQGESVSHLIKAASEALMRLSRLTADLVEASRDEPPRLDKSPLDLTEVVRQACSWLRPAAENKGLVLSCTCPQSAVWVQANRDSLMSVLGNLLSNAQRYTMAGGEVRVTVRAEADQARVEVRDTGIGMASEVRARIFEKFYRGPEARQVEAKGLGLGLSLVLQMIQAHEGHIAVESEQGQGSVFCFTLPLITPPISGNSAL
ncbi:MAG: sensor histidine kinase [Chloroflexota bacterium]